MTVSGSTPTSWSGPSWFLGFCGIRHLWAPSGKDKHFQPFPNKAQALSGVLWQSDDHDLSAPHFFAIIIAMAMAMAILRWRHCCAVTFGNLLLFRTGTCVTRLRGKMAVKAKRRCARCQNLRFPWPVREPTSGLGPK